MEKPIIITDEDDTSAIPSYTQDKRKLATKGHESNELDNDQPKETVNHSAVKFKLDSIDSFVDGTGYPVVWQQSFLCPCANPKTKAPDPLCPICHGTGIGYLPAKKDVHVLLQSQSKNAVLNSQVGAFEPGKALGTFERGCQVSIMDRIILSDTDIRQAYMFNVTEQRMADGFYIPYDVKNFIYIASMMGNKLVPLVEYRDYEYNDETHYITIKDNAYIGTTITMLINVTLRYIVSNVIREARFQYEDASGTGKQAHETMPTLAVLRRESAFINNVPLVADSKTDIENKASEAIDTASQDNGFGIKGV